jgi:bacteriorhodopsin
VELVLSEGQYQLVYNAFSFVVAAMFAAGLFFILSRNRISDRHRMAVTLSTLVVFIAGYHYFRIFGSWEGAFTETAAGFVQSGAFNEGYRYADWLLTVPLLLAELVLLLGLARSRSTSLITKLGVAAVLMIALGYPGEIATQTSTKWAWWAAAMVPFVYILWVLFGEFGRELRKMSSRAAGIIRGMRTLLLASWSVYPIAFLVPLMGLDATTAEVVRQVGYSVADVIAKPVFGLMLFAAARIMTEEEAAMPKVELATSDN